ncbi:MAG: cyclic 2,3-diphosphoglycerate synthase [Nitrososphaeria archaeon]
MAVTRVLIMGAGGRDFHNFNVYFRSNPNYRVVAFTAAQIPGIAGRRYPPELSGPLYPEGIPILPEEDLEGVIRRECVDLVVLSYSDLSNQELGDRLNRVLASGASFMVLGPRDTMLLPSKPTIAVTAVKTGAGKSTVSRAVVRELSSRGIRVAPLRHPMAYGDLSKTAVQRFATLGDLERAGLTIEEREEYEQYVRMGIPVFAGVDYARVLAAAEQEGQVILWDGGNNDFPFVRPLYMITVVDAMRPGLESSTFPGEANVMAADALVVNKADQARPEDLRSVVDGVRRLNPRASISIAESSVEVDDPGALRGRRALVIEDAPTVTHGGAPYGAGYVAAVKYGASVIDPRPYARGSLADVYRRYPHIGPVLPSMGYTEDQRRDLAETVRASPAEVVVLGTPADISALVGEGVRVVRVRYELRIVEGPTIGELVDEFLSRAGLAPGEKP